MHERRSAAMSQLRCCRKCRKRSISNDLPAGHVIVILLAGCAEAAASASQWKSLTVYTGGAELRPPPGNVILMTRYRTPAGWYSQDQQDRFAAEVLSNGSSGFFVDLAANDAVVISNTLALERRGWHGVCIEANPKYWWRLALRQCTPVCAAVGYPRGRSMRFALRNEYSKLSHATALRDSAEVALAPLEDVLTHAHAPRHIDLLSLDVEGAEEMVLQGFAWDRFTIGAMIVERPSQRLRDRLGLWGYTLLARIGRFGDEVFLHRDHPRRGELLRVLGSTTGIKAFSKQGKYGLEPPPGAVLGGNDDRHVGKQFAKDTARRAAKAAAARNGLAQKRRQSQWRRLRLHAPPPAEEAAAVRPPLQRGRYFVALGPDDPLEPATVALERSADWHAKNTTAEALTATPKSSSPYLWKLAGRNCTLLAVPTSRTAFNSEYSLERAGNISFRPGISFPPGLAMVLQMAGAPIAINLITVGRAGLPMLTYADAADWAPRVERVELPAGVPEAGAAAGLLGAYGFVALPSDRSRGKVVVTYARG
eukprot:TRINITY_DN14799_c0_g1_i1.p1 TRINITY_DN14799_c0_g1~~TRINITY_DN14799_c0_g1_i1.p1  ORF type:complete len:536 (+),score=64.70 TRINITY_DN14799_c0_g1_i1:63-1670(+)